MKSTRRKLIASFAGGTIVGGVGMLIATSDTGATIQWGNNLDKRVWIETRIQTVDRLLSTSETVYEDSRVLHRAVEHRDIARNVVPANAYDVSVNVLSYEGDRSTGPFTTRWGKNGCEHPQLIINVRRDWTVEFSQSNC